MNKPYVTVSVVSHEHADEIPHLLGDLADYAHQKIGEVVVTLNIPEPALSEWVEARDWPFKVRLIHNVAPKGYGANQNQAFNFCTTPFFCVMNPDIRLSHDPFPRMIAELQVPSSGCAYPMQSDGHGVPLDRAREMPTPSGLLRRYLVPGYRNKAQIRQWINGAFMLFPASAYSQVKGFDERYFMYCEDVDICLRLQLQGFTLVPVNDVVVEHMAQHASRRRIQHLVWHIQSLWRLWHSNTYKTYLSAPPDLDCKQET